MVHYGLFVWSIVEFVRWVHETAVEVRAQGNKYIPQFYMDVITHACLNVMEVNSSPASTTCMPQIPGLALVQIIACRLFGAKLLPEPLLTYCQPDPKEQTSVKIESKYLTFHSWKYIWQWSLRNGDHFAQGDMSEANPCSMHTVYVLLFLHQSMLLIACSVTALRTCTVTIVPMPGGISLHLASSPNEFSWYPIFVVAKYDSC